MFGYPNFDSKGVKTLTAINGVNSDMLMDILVVKLAKGKSYEYISGNKESAYLLTEGEVRFISDCVNETADRKNVFTDLPTCLHAPKGKKVKIEALADSEIIFLATLNDKDFNTKLYRKPDIICTVSCEGMWENTAVRDVNTIFDYDNAPYSNLVVGEVLARQGRWWSYVPHSHPQPEVYYYKFDRKEGFGACFIGEEAHTVKDGSVGCFNGGLTHVQVTAPGYPMYCCWMIRHLEGNPWKKTRTVDPRFVWLEAEGKK